MLTLPKHNRYDYSGISGVPMTASSTLAMLAAWMQ